MNLKIFYDTNRYCKEIDEFLEADKTLWGLFSSIHLHKLEEEIDPEEEFAAIYLINGTRSPSVHFLEHVSALITAGAHPHSMLFALNEADKLTARERAEVEQEFQAELEKRGWERPYSGSLWVSTQTFAIYREILRNPRLIPDTQLMFRDDENGAYLSVPQLIELNRTDKMLNFSQIPILMEKVSEQFVNTPELFVRRSKDKRNIYTYQVDDRLLDMLRNETELAIHHVNRIQSIASHLNEDVMLFQLPSDQWELSFLEPFKESRKAVVMVEGSEAQSIWELADRIQRLEKLMPGVTFFPFSPYVLGKLIGLESEGEKTVVPQCISDPEIVITDRNGFPVPKSSVLDWKQALHKACGLEQITDYLRATKKERTQDHAAAV